MAIGPEQQAELPAILKTYNLKPSTDKVRQ
jgi:hypothetical protein